MERAMTPAQHHATDGGAAIIAKALPSASVSIATVAGIPVNELLIWATLIYTCLMIGHKVFQIYKDVRGRDK